MILLNKHNDSYWYELFAKSTLEIVFPNEFIDLILSDRPDLICGDYEKGIEVVHPTDEEYEKINSYYHNQLEGKRIEDVSQKGLEIFRSKSYDVEFDIENKICVMKAPYKEFDIEIIYEAISKKTNKLNKNLYACSDNISLYLEMAGVSFESMDYTVAEKLLNYCLKLKRDNHIFFKEIFYSCLIKLYRIDIESRTILEIDTFALLDEIRTKFETVAIQNV